MRPDRKGWGGWMGGGTGVPRRILSAAHQEEEGFLPGTKLSTAVSGSREDLPQGCERSVARRVTSRSGRWRVRPRRSSGPQRGG